MVTIEIRHKHKIKIYFIKEKQNNQAEYIFILQFPIDMFWHTGGFISPLKNQQNPYELNRLLNILKFCTQAYENVNQLLTMLVNDWNSGGVYFLHLCLKNEDSLILFSFFENILVVLSISKFYIHVLILE